MTDIPELTPEQLARAIPVRVRRRLIAGKFQGGEDVLALRRFVGLTQVRFAQAIGISVHTLRNWEQGRRMPDGPAISRHRGWVRSQESRYLAGRRCRTSR